MGRLTSGVVTRATRVAAGGVLVALLTGALVFGGDSSVLAAVHPADPAVFGLWTPPFSEGGVFDDAPPMTKDEAARLPAASSVAVSPDGTVIYWNGFEGSEHLGPGFSGMQDVASRTRILDVRSFLAGTADQPTWIVPIQERAIGGDLFCSDLRNLPDGRLLVVGGMRRENLDGDANLPGGFGRPELWGLKSSRFYDPRTQTWADAAPMNYQRWYPSLVSLPSGKMLVAGGVDGAMWYWTRGPRFINQTETFDPASGRWTENGRSGEAVLPYYARLHLLPTGEVFYDASGQMWGPGGSTDDMLGWSIQKSYDPEANEWTEHGLAPFGARNGSFSAMLPLKPPYDRARILIAGGTLGATSPPSNVALDLTELVEVGDGSVERTVGPSLTIPRWHSSPVVLPSGEVIAVNGGDRDDTLAPGTTSAVRQAEMFDGVRWVPLASATRERIYHSSAILLGDGSILVGGHAPLPTLLFGPGNNDTFDDVFTSNFRDPSFEIFRPPYLFRGQRPRITAVRSGIALGDTFEIATPDAARVTSVVLSRLPAVTHISDSDQRTIELEFTPKSPGLIEARVPDDSAVALPGHYYLFLMSDNGQGPTPSRAAIVRIGETDYSDAPLPFGS